MSKWHTVTYHQLMMHSHQKNRPQDTACLQLLNKHSHHCYRQWPACSYQVLHESSHSTVTGLAADAVLTVASSPPRFLPPAPRTSSGTSAPSHTLFLTKCLTVCTGYTGRWTRLTNYNQVYSAHFSSIFLSPESRVQTPGYIPKKITGFAGVFFGWTHLKNPANKTHQKPTSTEIRFCSLCY